MDSVALSATVKIIRQSGIAVVTIEDGEGRGFDLDWPKAMLPEGTKHGTKLEIEVRPASRTTEGEGE